MTDFELNTHARLVALEHLLQNLYYMHYRSIGATSSDISAHHDGLLEAIKTDLRRSLVEFGFSMDRQRATSIALAVQKHLDKNLEAVRGMWETAPRSSS